MGEYLFSLGVAAAAQNAAYDHFAGAGKPMPATPRQELWLTVAVASFWLLALAGLLVFRP